MKQATLPTKESILEASERIAPFVHRTALLRSAFFDAQTEASLLFKCENFQKAGAFKSRGATNACLQLTSEEKKAGVATHSSGNHAQALARAAGILGIKSHIVMPETAAKIKVEATRQYGGNIRFCKPTLAAREQTLQEIVEQTGATVIHPYNDFRIIEGQATACLELLSQTSEKLDYVFCPVGGGGLLSGTALALNYFSPETKLIGCEPLHANDAKRSFDTKTFVPSENPKTIADGLLTSLGSLTFPIICDFVSAIVTVDEHEIIAALRLVWERMKIIIEPSSAVAVAVAISGKINLKNKKAAIILSGGNVDLNQLAFVFQ